MEGIVNDTIWSANCSGGVNCSNASANVSVDSNKTCTNDYCATDDDYIDLIEAYIFPSVYEWILIGLHCLVFVVGLVGNFLVCLAVYRNHTMRTGNIIYPQYKLDIPRHSWPHIIQSRLCVADVTRKREFLTQQDIEFSKVKQRNDFFFLFLKLPTCSLSTWPSPTSSSSFSACRPPYCGTSPRPGSWATRSAKLYLTFK